MQVNWSAFKSLEFLLSVWLLLSPPRIVFINLQHLSLCRTENRNYNIQSHPLLPSRRLGMERYRLYWRTLHLAASVVSCRLVSPSTRVLAGKLHGLQTRRWRGLFRLCNPLKPRHHLRARLGIIPPACESCGWSFSTLIFFPYPNLQ